ncbi:hypothetical protein [Kitasatospora sp. NPDC050543]|uniref:hypothetical protein n=1 Tax=Kitasatospora sp. NPDC050543 TaxID=3364054 RepID=UPI0037B491A4
MSRISTLAAAGATALLALSSLTACGPDNSSADAAATPAATAGGTAKPTPGTTTGATGGATTAGATAGTADASGVPASAWIAAADIPLAAAYHWQPPAGAAATAKNPKFQFEQLCRSTRAPENDLGDWKGPAAQASLVAGNRADWQVKQTIIHFPGTSSMGAQMASSLYRGLEEELKACGTSVRGATAKVTGTSNPTDGNSDLAATVTVPVQGGTSTLHVYLSLTGRVVTELALWSDRPAHPWAAPADADVLKALAAPICPAVKDC